MACRRVGPSQGKLHIGAHGSPILLQQNCRFRRLTLRQKHAGIADMGVADEQRIRMGFGKVGQGCKSLGRVSGLQVSGSQVIVDVIAQVSRMNLSPAERIDGAGIVSIEHVCVAQH